MLKIIIIAVILVAVATAAMGIRLLLNSDSEFRGGRCSPAREGNESNVYTCGCGEDRCQFEDTE